MANNYDEYDYDNDKNNDSGLIKKLIVIILIVIAVIIILFLLKGCTNRNNENNKNGNNEQEVVLDSEKTLVTAGKKYFENNFDELPTSIGECSQVTLNTLVEKGLVDVSKFELCSNENTYVRVCVLENSSYQYTPWFTCNDKTSDLEYDLAQEGTMQDIINDKSYVTFKFLAEELKAGSENLGPVEEMWKSDIKYSSYKTLGTTTYYRYRDKLFTWNVTSKKYYTRSGEKNNASDVKEYYVSAPSSNYQNSDSKTTEAYKWYTTTSVKEFALDKNGAKAFSDKPIGDYNMPSGGVIKTAYQTRTVTGSTAPTKYYACSTSATATTIIYQPTPCNSENNINSKYTYLRDIIYSCVSDKSNVDSVLKNKVASTDKCNTYSKWSTSFTPCTSKDINVCRSVDVTFYNWYKLTDNGDKTYYPSGSSNASGEKVYYTSAPVDGAVKDTTTKATAYKWYSVTNKTTSEYTAVAPSGYSSATKTDNYKLTEWSKWSTTNPKTKDGRSRTIETKVKIKLQQILGTNNDTWTEISDYMTEEEMISVLQNKGYNVNSLEDINNNGQLRYQVKMMIRNKKEGIN